MRQRNFRRFGARPVVGITAALAVGGLFLSACSSSTTSESSAAESTAAESTAAGSSASTDASTPEPSAIPADAEVGFSEAQLSDAFQVVLVKNVESSAVEQELNVQPAVNANGDPAKQNADISTLLSSGVTGLLISAVNSDAIIPAIEQANAANVPVVTMDTKVNGGKVYMMVRSNNVDMAKSACQEMGTRLNGKGSVVDMQGALTSADGVDRSEGFVTCMQENFPDITVTSKPMEWDPEICTSTLQTLLTTSQVDGIYMGSETICLPGLTKLLEQQGIYKKVGEPGHIVTVGIDGTAFGLEQVRAGYMDAVISQPVNLYAKYGVSYMKDALAGIVHAPGPTDHNSVIEALPDGNLVDQLPPDVVTIDNVDNPDFWGNSAQ